MWMDSPGTCFTASEAICKSHKSVGERRCYPVISYSSANGSGLSLVAVSESDCSRQQHEGTRSDPVIITEATF